MDPAGGPEVGDGVGELGAGLWCVDAFEQGGQQCVGVVDVGAPRSPANPTKRTLPRGPDGLPNHPQVDLLRNQSLMPPDVREWLPEGHLAWFVLDAVGEMDLAAFYAAYRRTVAAGRPMTRR